MTQDIEGRIGEPGSGAEYEMFSYDRPSVAFWDGFYRTLAADTGFDHDDIVAIMQSIMIRHELDAFDLRDAGRKFAEKLISDRKSFKLAKRAAKFAREVRRDEAEEQSMTQKESVRGSDVVSRLCSEAKPLAIGAKVKLKKAAGTPPETATVRKINPDGTVEVAYDQRGGKTGNLKTDEFDL